MLDRGGVELPALFKIDSARVRMDEHVAQSRHAQTMNDTFAPDLELRVAVAVGPNVIPDIHPGEARDRAGGGDVQCRTGVLPVLHGQQ